MPGFITYLRRNEFRHIDIAGFERGDFPNSVRGKAVLRLGNGSMTGFWIFSTLTLVSLFLSFPSQKSYRQPPVFHTSIYHTITIPRIHLTMTENKQLSDYLNEKLPGLSLDTETYIPYIIGCLEQFQDDEELDEIIDLLQASSETHSDDEEIWPKLKQDILALHRGHKEGLEQTKKQESEERKEMEARKKKEEMEEANRERERKRLADEEKARKNELDPAKKALLAQYAYDVSETYDNDGKIVDSGGKDGDEEGGSSNRATAEKMNKERSQQLKGAHSVTKKDERAKTKQAKVDKIDKKEERRNRARKGERKR